MELGGVGRLGPLLVQSWLGSWRRRWVWDPWLPVGMGPNFQVWEPHVFGPDAGWGVILMLTAIMGGGERWMGSKGLSQISSCPQ